MVYESVMDFDPMFDNDFSRRPSWAVNPNALPLYVKAEKMGLPPMLKRSLLWKAFARGIITVKLC